MKAFLLIISVCIISSAKAKNYYFSANSGDDSRTTVQAQSSSTPWKTLSKLNTFFISLQSGDSVLLKRGETFDGSIIVSISGSINLPIVLGAYGTGSRPVINGFTTLTGWVAAGNNVYESYNSALGTNISLVAINGTQQPQGRYPNYNTTNKGYLTFESHGTNFIIDNELTSGINWTGAEVVVKPKRWILDRMLVTAHSGNKLTYSPALTYVPYDNYGYFIQNHIKTLDMPGEWYYNPSTKKVSVFSIPGVFQASTVNILVSIRNQSNIVFDNLVFKGSNQRTFDIYTANNIRIANCDILLSGIDGIFASTTTNLMLENNTLSYTNNNAINLSYNCNNSIIRKNVIRNTGMFSGAGSGGNGTYQAVTVIGKNNLIEYNEIDSTGFTALRFAGGDSNVIKNNFINYFTLTKDDGGGISTGVSDGATYYGQKIIGNIVLNGIGISEGTDKPGTSSSNGIYIDDNSSNVEIAGNTVSNCGRSGVILHNSFKITVQNNTLFNNATQLSLLHDIGMPNALPRNYIIRNNIFFSKTAPQAVSNVSTIGDDIKLIGSVDTNYYCRPVDDNLVTTASYINLSGTRVDQLLDLKGWQTNYNLDKASIKTPSQIPPYTVTSGGVNKLTNGTFNTNNSGLYSSSSNSWNSNKLDGGTFQASNASATTSTYSVIIAAGAIEANKNYLLKFTSQSAKDTLVNVFLRVSGAPYTRLSEIKIFKITPLRQENEFLFSLPAAAATASIIFETKCPKLTFWLDNIELMEANVTFTNPDDYIRFEYNSSNVNRSVALPGIYNDVKNKQYVSSIVLAPYTSVVLLKEMGLLNVLPLTFLNFNGSLQKNSINLKWITNGTNTKFFEIQKSTDQGAYTLLQKVAANNVSGTSTYNYDDKDLQTGNIFYRLKKVDADGKFAYSKIVHFKYSGNIRFEISPNPVKNNLSVLLTGLQKNKELKISILSGTGRLIKTLNLNTAFQVIPVDVSNLNNGVYIIQAVCGDIVVNRQFIKL